MTPSGLPILKPWKLIQALEKIGFKLIRKSE